MVSWYHGIRVFRAVLLPLDPCHFFFRRLPLGLAGQSPAVAANLTLRVNLLLHCTAVHDTKLFDYAYLCSLLSSCFSLLFPSPLALLGCAFARALSFAYRAVLCCAVDVLDEIKRTQSSIRQQDFPPHRLYLEKET